MYKPLNHIIYLVIFYIKMRNTNLNSGRILKITCKETDIIFKIVII